MNGGQDLNLKIAEEPGNHSCFARTISGRRVASIYRPRRRQAGFVRPATCHCGVTLRFNSKSAIVLSGIW
jgi:hypothetical protein